MLMFANGLISHAVGGCVASTLRCVLWYEGDKV